MHLHLTLHRRMYWCDWSSFSHIAMAGMDGKNFEIIVHENLEWPKSLTIDYPNDRLYWIDAKSKIIESCGLDGEDRRVSAWFFLIIKYFKIQLRFYEIYL